MSRHVLVASGSGPRAREGQVKNPVVVPYTAQPTTGQRGIATGRLEEQLNRNSRLCKGCRIKKLFFLFLVSNERVEALLRRGVVCLRRKRRNPA